MMRVERRDWGMIAYAAIVLGHWGEHLLQAFQIWVLGWPPPRALGALGLLAPGLVRSEWLHWGYNLFVLVGAILLLGRFAGRARGWWMAAIVVQVWHFLEHGLLLGQAILHRNLLGTEVPTSVLQLVVPRVELHLAYNGIVTALLIWAVVSQYRAAMFPRRVTQAIRPVEA